MAKVKWAITIDSIPLDWVKDVAQEAEVNFGTVVEEVIMREMKNKNSRLREDLSQAKIRLELERVNDEQLKLETRRTELTKKLKADRVLQTA